VIAMAGSGDHPVLSGVMWIVVAVAAVSAIALSIWGVP